MDTTKPWYLSRTIWASLVTVALSVAGIAGLRSARWIAANWLKLWCRR